MKYVRGGVGGCGEGAFYSRNAAVNSSCSEVKFKSKCPYFVYFYIKSYGSNSYNLYRIATFKNRYFEENKEHT